MDYAPLADFDLLLNARNSALSKGLQPKIGNILASDVFYNEDPEQWKLWARFNVLAVEMETSALYTLAAKYRRRALSVLTVSDSMITGEETTAEERERTFSAMVEVALDIVP
jgi:purine-nucleoside phosphorylase